VAGRINRLARRRGSAVAAALAQAWCGDVAVRAAEEAIQLHGGIGMTWEHPYGGDGRRDACSVNGCQSGKT
jgi:alkylation response protein AidB-like acyl-CoA dehydrogenase